MTADPHMCSYCNTPIPDPDDAVYMGHEMSDSGPGWEIWAHRAHADLIQPDPVATAALARVLIVLALRQDD